MAKVKSKNKRAKEQESRNTSEVLSRLRRSFTSEVKPAKWLENKIAAARKLSKHRAARAAARYGAPAGVALLFFIFVYSLFLPKDRFQLAKERLVKNPNDFEARLVLAEEYLANNQIEKAERELLIVDSRLQTVDRDEQVLGEASLLEPENWLVKTKQLWQRKQESNPEEIKELIKYWEGIISEKPDYRDGYLQLALFHYKLYENKKAKEYLEKAIELGPNYEPARKLEKILGD